jgi:hypothetical protein
MLREFGSIRAHWEHSSGIRAELIRECLTGYYGDDIVNSEEVATLFWMMHSAQPSQGAVCRLPPAWLGLQEKLTRQRSQNGNFPRQTGPASGGMGSRPLEAAGGMACAEI